MLSNFGNDAMFPTANITIYGLPIEKINKIIRMRWGGETALRSKVKVEIAEEGGILSRFILGE